MQVRRCIVNECKGQPKIQKALAFALLLKERLGRSSMMRDYSTNKIHSLTKVSPTTINKYMPILKERGWVKFVGKNEQHLIVRKMCSHHEAYNISVDNFCYKSFRDVYYSLRSFMALIIQSHKDFIKRTIQIATMPQRGQDFKAARKLLKRLVMKGVVCSLTDAYKECGLSLQRIARETGNCVKTAQRIMAYAINKRWAKKQHIYQKVASGGVFDEGFTFYKNGHLYKIYANRYSLSRSVAKGLSHGTISW